jgi:hypothetical protein
LLRRRPCLHQESLLGDLRDDGRFRREVSLTIVERYAE